MLFTILGIAIIALPFIVIFTAGVKMVGWIKTLFALGIAMAVVMIFALGNWLLSLGGIIR